MTSRMFTSADAPLPAVLAGLAAQGYEVGAAATVTRTLLDTFDGRLHGAGLRAEVEQVGDRMSLLVTGAGAVPARADVATVPRVVGDLPAGPLRSRLAPVVDVRALLPRVAVAARRRAVTRSDRGRVVVEAAVYDNLTGDTAADALAAYTVEVAEMAGYAQPAAALMRVLVDLGLQLTDGDTLDAARVASGVSAGGFDSSPRIPLAADVPAVEGFAAVLGHLAQAIEANWQGTVDDVDPEFLHDLRVAVRRTRSVLSQAKRVLPADVRHRYRIAFKELGDATGPARDLDVYVLEWSGYVAPIASRAADLEPVLAEIQRRREVAHVQLARKLGTRRAMRTLSAWQRWLADPRAGGPPGRDADAPLGGAVVDRITRAQKDLIERGRSIGPASPGEELHEMRKDAKKLRYLIECFGGLLPAAGRKAFVQRLKALQENLGEHQDAEVHVEQLRDLAGDLKGRGAAVPTLLAVGELVGQLEQRRQSSRDEFTQRFADYDSKATRLALAELLDAVAP